jgi:uncharacterized oligopeptide transporter (OPT) family protein
MNPDQKPNPPLNVSLTQPTTTLPTLPDDASPEEKDLYWLDHIYQGNTQRQLTFRAVLTGGLLGMFMCISNLYTTLKIGWSFGVAITACVLSYVTWSVVRAASGNRLRPLSILENNCMQSTASAAGYSTGSTLGTAFGALLLIEGVHRPWWVTGLFVLFTAALGVFIAIPMKRHMINHEQLKFPSGTAAAETLRSLYASGREAMHKAYSLVLALIIGGLIGLVRTWETLSTQLKNSGRAQPWLEKLTAMVQLPEQIAFTGFLNPLNRGQMAGLAFEPSVLLIGAGMIIGVRVSLSMLAGSIVLYYIVAPHLLGIDMANAGAAGYIRSFTVSPSGMFNPTRWALWGGTSVMVFSSLAAVALQWRTVARAFAFLRPRGPSSDQDRLAAIEVPNRWLIVGLVPIGIGLIAIQYIAFHINFILGLIAVLMSAVVALVASRATGETDTTPTGAMGKVTQLLYAVLPGARGNTVVNLMSAGATASAAMSSADLLSDLKSGYILGANPRKQFLAQFFGVFFGTIALIPAWYAMVPDKKTLEAFNPPAANMWKAVADLLTQGIHMLPKSAVWAITFGAVIGVLIPVLEQSFPRSRTFLPSAMGLGLSWVLPFQNTLAFAIGGVIAWVWLTINRRTAETFVIPIASGFVAGESLIAALIAIACTIVGFLALK